MRAYQSENRRETLDYARSMLGELRTLAEAERCDMLAYLIEMAYVEASDILRGERPYRLRDEPPQNRPENLDRFSESRMRRFK